MCAANVDILILDCPQKNVHDHSVIRSNSPPNLFLRTLRRCCATEFCHCLYKSYWQNVCHPTIPVVHDCWLLINKNILIPCLSIFHRVSFIPVISFPHQPYCTYPAHPFFLPRRTQQTLERLRCPRASSFSSSQRATKNVLRLSGESQMWKLCTSASRWESWSLTSNDHIILFAHEKIIYV